MTLEGQNIVLVFVHSASPGDLQYLIINCGMAIISNTKAKYVVGYY